MTNALTTTNGNGRALDQYQQRDDVRELGDRLMAMHPAAGEVGAAGMRAAAQLALMLGVNPLPGVNELHVWKDNKGRTCISLGVNYWRRKAQEWGGVLYETRPRAMRPAEAQEYGIPGGTTAAICRGVRTEDMLKFHALGFSTSDIWNMCAATGVGTVGANEYAKSGRPLLWTATKRAETDMLRQLFPAQVGNVASTLADASVSVLVDDMPEADGGDRGVTPPHYTLTDANRDLFGDDTPTAALPAPTGDAADAADAPEDGDYEDAPAPADSGPLPDDEQVIKETAAEQYLATVAALLDTDADAVKARMKALGYTGISRYVEQRLDTYRLLRDDRPKSLQADLFGDDNAADRAASLATAQDRS